MQKFINEVCVDNTEDAMRAIDLGANRIEYCSCLLYTSDAADE